MPRTRVISQVEALYTTTSPALQDGTMTGIQLHRVQSVSNNWSVNHVNVNQFGQLSPVARIINESPTASIDFSYYLTNLLNEYNLGFTTDNSTTAISGFLTQTTDERNYFLVQAPEGDDLIGYAGDDRTVYGVGNGFIRSYSTEAAVNGFPTSTVRVEGLNLVAYNVPSGVTPAVSPSNATRGTGLFTIPVAITGTANQAPVLKHGDITMNLGSSVVGVDLTDAKIQRYTLSFDLGREPQQKLGSQYAFSRLLVFPITVTLSVEANLGDLATGSVTDIICNDTDYNLSILLRKPNCSGNGTPAVQFTLNGAKLDSTNWNSTIGPNKTVTMQWSSTIGGPQDTTHQFLMSGVLD